jgi:Methyltransferase domain
MNDSMQLSLLREHFPKLRDEYKHFPVKPAGRDNQFRLENQFLAGRDALVAYCMVRHFQPRLIIEVEPFPRQFLREGFPGLQLLIEKKIQEIDLEFFSRLDSGDILFIDSSHTVKIGGDVNYLFLEVLPRLKPGVIAHVHDISLPFEYRRDWMVDKFCFWSEQYLLQALLMFNSEFEVLLASSYLNHYHREDLMTAFGDLTSCGRRQFLDAPEAACRLTRYGNKTKRTTPKK